MTPEHTRDQPATQEALFRLMADRIPGVVWSVDTALRFTWSFGAGLEALGLHPSEVVGRTLFEYFRTDDENLPVIAAHRRALSGESVKYEESWSGRIYLVHIERLNDGDGQVVGCIGFAHDVTEKSQTESELRNSETKWRSVVSNAPSFIVLVDRDGTLQYLNRTQPGMTVEESIGKSVYSFTEPQYHEHVRDALNLVFERGKSSSFESVAAGPDGEPVWYETHVGPVMMDDRVVSATLIALEITDRKRVHDELERKVDERTKELNKQAQTLRNLLLASDHERQIIAYEIHDTLAQWIVGAKMQFEAYERLKEDNPRRAAEAFRDGMDVLRQSQQQARNLIRGVRPITLDQMGVVGVITHMVKGFDEEETPRIELHTDVSFDRLEPVQENSIYRIVQEALRNARKHSRGERVRIEVTQHDDQLRIVIQDWGIGFDMREIGEYQFGLDGIRVRARLLGGRAEIESQLGKGTRISVTIPIVERKVDD